MVESLAQERGLLATFMPKPFANLTGNGCHFHFSLWRDGENVFECDPADDPRGLGLSPLAYNFIGGLKAHAKAYIALTAPTVNSYKRLVVGAPDQRRHVGARLHQLRLQQPHPDAPDPGRRADRGPHRRRLVQPVPGGDRDARRRARRDRARARGRRAQLGQPVRAVSRGARGRRESTCCPATCSTPPASSRRTTCCARRSARPATATTSTTSSRSSAGEWQAAHEQITQWELDRYLQLF